jgi:hypothetical protein
MPLLGQAAMLLNFDVDEAAVAEHDDWHSHEHLPERLAIPGFLRGTRWVATQGGPRYLVLYEVQGPEVLVSGAYLDRLNHPTPWTSKMMRHYRGMTRGLCTVVHSRGAGMGHSSLLVHFKPAAGAESSLEAWLAGVALPPLATQRGLISVHLLRGAAPAPMTAEQRMRGADAAVDWALLATGYEREALQRLALNLFSASSLEAQGAAGVRSATYDIACTLTTAELPAFDARRG